MLNANEHFQNVIGEISKLSIVEKRQLIELLNLEIEKDDPKTSAKKRKLSRI